MMSRTLPKSSLKPKLSPTDEYARRIARAISKGRTPSLGNRLEDYCDSCPEEVFAAFAGAAKHMPPAGKDEALAISYLLLLQRLLEHLRYRTDRGYPEAARLIADFQSEVVARVETGDIDERMLVLVSGALHQSKIPASPELVAASARLGVDQAGEQDDEDEQVPADLRAAIGEVFEAFAGDPFRAIEALSEYTHALPADARDALAGALSVAAIPDARSAAVLLLLDPDPGIRRTVAGALGQIADALTPTDLRRLIAMRNWRPENERAEVDAIIRKARAAGIDCAQWEMGSIETVAATAIDGAATQGFLLVSPAGRKKRISSILTKGGIADAWSGAPESPRRIEGTLADAAMNATTLAVSRRYLDRTVAHHLALSTEKGEAPPIGLLQVAETIGGADWQPARMIFSEELAGLIAEIPKSMYEPAAFASVLRESGELAGLGPVVESWFEDDSEVAEAVERARARDRTKLASYLLQTAIARRRDRWAEIVLHAALLMREAPPEADLCWRELALVAKALADGRDMTEIGLMHDIAMRTIAVLRSGGPM